MSATRRVLDVSPLPTGAFGHHGLVWWGTAGFMVIEGSMLLMVLIAYFYLRLQVSDWPPSRPNPDIMFGTLNLLLVLVSLVPAALAKFAAEKLDLRAVRIWLGVLTIIGIGSLVLRTLEFPALNTRWDDNAYGSIVWLVLGLHTAHVAVDVVDSAVLLTMMFTGPITKKRMIDVSENSLYWYFIVFWWIPVYLTIYFAPRWL
jgi:cytochrome c oxidase subunit III